MRTGRNVIALIYLAYGQIYVEKAFDARTNQGPCARHAARAPLDKRGTHSKEEKTSLLNYQDSQMHLGAVAS